jgi:serine/threonine-protein kinase
VVSSTDPFGLIGQVLDGQFRVDKFVGEGGFSVVYRGHHVGLEEPIAIKCLKLPIALGSALVDSFVRRFRDESRLHYKLSQGNLSIARTLAHGTTMAPSTAALVPYMVLEWLEGRALASDLEVRRAYGDTGRPIADVIAILDAAAEGLAYAHANGVVHRDINPGNLFLAHTSQGTRLKVLDFGVAKVLSENALAFGPRVHTIGQIRIFSPQYAAPEQFDEKVGPIGAWTDVYSFALIALEMLRDKPAIEGEHLGDFASRALDPLVRPSPRRLGLAVPDLTEQVFAGAVALKPEERPQDVGQFWGSLKNAVQRDAELGNVAFAEPGPRSAPDTSGRPSSNTKPNMKVPPVTTLSVEKVPIPVRPIESVVSVAPNTPTKDIPIQLQADEYLAGEPPTKVFPSPLEELGPQTARMANAPAREEPRRSLVNSGAGALAAAFPLPRSPPHLATTRPSQGNEASAGGAYQEASAGASGAGAAGRPAAPEIFVGGMTARSAEGVAQAPGPGPRSAPLESAVPATPPATEVKVPTPPAPIPNVFEERRRASDPLMAPPVMPGAPVPPAAPLPPVPVAASLGPQITTGPMTVVAVPVPGPGAGPGPSPQAHVPPAVRHVMLGTALMPRAPLPSSAPPGVPPAPVRAASQPPANALAFPPPRRDESRPPDSDADKPTRIGHGALASMSPLYAPPPGAEPPRPPETPSMSIHIPKKSAGALAFFLVFFVLLVLSAVGYVGYAYYLSRRG